jgi:energy-converting hydrogenase Eha subunit C
VSDAPDPRPRPAYGEYATPEEQRARIRQPDVESVLDGSGAAASVPAPAVEAPPVAMAGHPLDRIITIALLAMGAVNVFLSVPGFLDLSETFARTMAAMGIPGEFSNFAAAQTWGAVASVVMVAGYLLTAVATWRRLRAGRMSWWLPVVGAVITFVLTVVCLAVPLWGDPAFQAYVNSMS